MLKNDDWFNSIKWDNVCLACQKNTNGNCSIRSCAEMCYDENGNLIPETSVEYDGDYKKETEE